MRYRGRYRKVCFVTQAHKFLCSATFMLFLAVLPSACSVGGELGEYDLPRSPVAEETPWPRLVDVPEAPPPGIYTHAVPNPAEGAATQVRLRAEARRMRLRAEALNAPVLSAGERARLRRGVRSR